MANLEGKDSISPIQIAILVVMGSIGGEMLGLFQDIAKQAAQGMWISIVIAGGGCYLAARFMIKLGQSYPGQTLVQYLPQLWGKWASRFILGWFISLFVLHSAISLAEFSQVITFFMFDRTPNEVVGASLLAVCVYGAVQDWGTLIRLMQFMFFVTMPVVFVIWLVSIFNFQPEFLLPLWPQDINGILAGTVASVHLYDGYQLVLLLIPLLARSQVKVKTTVGYAFILLSSFFAVAAILVIGTLSAEVVKNVEYPALATLRSIEIPGTFIERLENYMLLVWVPIVFCTIATLLVISSRLLAEWLHYQDHRPIVLLVTPLVFMISLLSADMSMKVTLKQITLWLSSGFSFGFVPISFLLIWLKQRIQPNSLRKVN